MKMTVLDVVQGISKSGRPFIQGAFRGKGRSGNDFLFIARCPLDTIDSIGTEIDKNVVFSQSGNYLIDY